MFFEKHVGELEAEETSGRNLDVVGDMWEASGKHLRGIWESLGLQEAMGLQEAANHKNRCPLSAKMQKFL